MTLKQAIKILKAHNRWRRGDKRYMMVDTSKLGIAIDIIVAHLEKPKPQTLTSNS